VVAVDREHVRVTRAVALDRRGERDRVGARVALVAVVGEVDRHPFGCVPGTVM